MKCIDNKDVFLVIHKLVDKKHKFYESAHL